MASKIKQIIQEFLNKNITENIDIYDFLNEKREEIILKYGPETFRSLQNLLMIDKDGMGEIKVKKFMEDENFIEKEDIPFEENLAMGVTGIPLSDIDKKNMKKRKQQLKEVAEEKAMVYFLKKLQAGEIDKLPDNPLHAYIDLQMKGEVNEASSISKRRAQAELKQQLKGKRADGMGDYTAQVYGMKGNERVPLTSMNDINKFSKFELGDKIEEAEEEEEIVKIKGDNFKKHDITNITEDRYITEKWDYEDEVMEGTCGYSEDGKPGKTPGGIKSMPADKRTKRISKRN